MSEHVDRDKATEIINEITPLTGKDNSKKAREFFLRDDSIAQYLSNNKNIFIKFKFIYDMSIKDTRDIFDSFSKISEIPNDSAQFPGISFVMSQALSKEIDLFVKYLLMLQKDLTVMSEEKRYSLKRMCSKTSECDKHLSSGQVRFLLDQCRRFVGDERTFSRFASLSFGNFGSTIRGIYKSFLKNKNIDSEKNEETDKNTEKDNVVYPSISSPEIKKHYLDNLEKYRKDAYQEIMDIICGIIIDEYKHKYFELHTNIDLYTNFDATNLILRNDAK